MAKKVHNDEYSALRLPKALIDKLRFWKQAASMSASRPVSYAELIQGMLDCLDETDPDITAKMDLLIKSNPEIEKIISKVVK